MSTSSGQPPAPPTILHPTTPSKRRGTSNTSQGTRIHHRDHPRDGRTTPLLDDRAARHQTAPATPSRRHNSSNTTLTAPETPKRRKENASKRLPGIKTQLPANLSIESIRTRLVETLGLSYVPDDWQIHLIRRILQAYDSIFCAGTGYGKSLIFEALAVLGGQRKLVIVISPLKALEHDQADQATAKGIETVVVNEDTTKTANLWKEVRSTAAMVYMSPEMSLSDSFQKLWKDSRFRKRLTAVIVDEAHCIDEWGDDTFRPLYRKLNTLRTAISCDASVT